MESSQFSPVWLFIQALAEARSADAVASICTMADIDGPGWLMQPPLDPGFGLREARTEAELTDAVNELLGNQVVVLIPPWGRLPGEKAERQEIIALNCPARPTSHELILVLPASSLVSHRGENFRRRFFETWEPTAIAFITGGISGVHPSFRTAVIQAAPRAAEGNLLRMFEAPP